MEIIERANLESRNDKLGMMLEWATVKALKNIPLYTSKTSQFNEFYQKDHGKGPDVLFEFGNDKKIGCIECKNVNNNFLVFQSWFDDKVYTRFFPMYKGLAAYIVVISQFKTSPPELASKLKQQYHILDVGFQIIDKKTFHAAIPIIENKLRILIECLNNNPTGLKKGYRPC